MNSFGVALGIPVSPCEGSVLVGGKAVKGQKLVSGLLRSEAGQKRGEFGLEASDFWSGFVILRSLVPRIPCSPIGRILGTTKHQAMIIDHILPGTGGAFDRIRPMDIVRAGPPMVRRRDSRFDLTQSAHAGFSVSECISSHSVKTGPGQRHVQARRYFRRYAAEGQLHRPPIRWPRVVARPIVPSCPLCAVRKRGDERGIAFATAQLAKAP